MAVTQGVGPAITQWSIRFLCVLSYDFPWTASYICLCTLNLYLGKIRVVPDLPTRNHCESLFDVGKLIHILKTNTSRLYQ